MLENRNLKHRLKVVMSFGKIHTNIEGKKYFCYFMIGLDQEGRRVVVNSDPVEEPEIFRLNVKLLTIIMFYKME